MRTWEADPARAFETNFVPSAEIVAAKLEAVAHASALAAATAAATAESVAAGAHDNTEDADLHETAGDDNADMVYSFSRRSIEKMINDEHPAQSSVSGGASKWQASAGRGFGGRRKTGVLKYIATTMPELPTASGQTPASDK